MFRKKQKEKQPVAGVTPYPATHYEHLLGKTYQDIEGSMIFQVTNITYYGEVGGFITIVDAPVHGTASFGILIGDLLDKTKYIELE